MGAEVFEEDVERGLEERRVFRLQDKIIAFLRREHRGDVAAEARFAQAVFDLVPEIGPPAAEVVVDVDDRDAGGAGALFQCDNPTGGGHRMAEEGAALGEIEVVDDVDEDQHGLPAGWIGHRRDSHVPGGPAGVAGPCDPIPMDEKIHVMPLGDQWEVETDSGAPLAHADSQGEAVEAAKDLANEQGGGSVILHHEDGVTEEVSPKD